MGRLCLGVILLLLPACFGEPDYAGKHCGQSGACPAGLTCSPQTGTCELEARPDNLSAGPANSNCAEGQLRACYEGPPATLKVGTCAAGNQVCKNGTFGPCEGQVRPAPQDQCTGLDESCDGTPDQGCPVGQVDVDLTTTSTGSAGAGGGDVWMAP